MLHVQRRLEVSERRACRVLSQPRSTQRLKPRIPDRDRTLARRIKALARKYPRYGYRRIWALLRREGWNVNLKRVHRLWKQGGHRVVARQRKRRRLGTSENGSDRLCAEYKSHVWSYDFTMDQTVDGSRLKMMPVVDEFTRECHVIEVARSITAADVIAVLEHLFQVHGEPEYLRSDNGPEFIARAVRTWLAASGVKTLFIAPGSPWENAYVESFNSRLEDELLGRESFGSLREARVLVERWRLEYNHERPHSGLGYRTPVEYASSLDPVNVASRACGAPALDLPRGEGRELITVP